MEVRDGQTSVMVVRAGAAALVVLLAGCATVVPADRARPVQTSPAVHTRVQQMIDSAMAQVGDTYLFGVEVSPTDPDPDAWYLAELTRWSAWQVGSVLPGSSFEQYLDAKAKGLLIPVDRGTEHARRPVVPLLVRARRRRRPTGRGTRRVQSRCRAHGRGARRIDGRDQPETPATVSSTPGSVGDLDY